MSATQDELVAAWQPYFDRAERAYDQAGGTVPHDGSGDCVPDGQV